MKKNSLDWSIIIVIAIILIILSPLVYYDNTWKKQAIQNWASEHHATVVDLEPAGFFEFGPFYYRGKGQSIYRGKLKGSNYDIWFRTSIWGTDALNSRGEEIKF